MQQLKFHSSHELVQEDTSEYFSVIRCLMSVPFNSADARRMVVRLTITTKGKVSLREKGHT